MGFRFKSDSDKWAAINGLRVAAERFTDHAGEFEKLAKPTNGFGQLVQQFKDQADTARRIASEIEEAEG